MDNNWRPTPPGGEASMDTGDWRSQLQPDSRQRIVNKIMDTLKRHLPFSGQEGLNELKKIAARFEEKIFTAATCQTDYLRKTSLKLLTMESKSQNPLPNSMASNNPGSTNKPPDQEERTKPEHTESGHLTITFKDKKRKRYTGEEAAVGTSQSKTQKKMGEEFICYFCKETGHMKKECSKYAAWHVKKCTLLTLVCSEVNLASVPSHTWWVDYGLLM